MSLEPLDWLSLLSSGRCWNFSAVRADANDGTSLQTAEETQPLNNDITVRFPFFFLNFFFSMMQNKELNK